MKADLFLLFKIFAFFYLASLFIEVVDFIGPLRISNEVNAAAAAAAAAA